MRHSFRQAHRRLALLLPFALLAIVAWALLVVGSASAAPTEPTISLDDLRTAIAGTPGGVDGYFKTVLEGSTITPVSCKILAVVDGANDDGSPLIMFRVTDATVLGLGGVAEGMSGSPLFVSGAPDKLAGAVSYGYYLTVDGLGLATPIDLMTSVESKYQLDGSAPSVTAGPTSLGLRLLPDPVVPKVQTRRLAQPVRAAGTTIRRVLIARSLKAARTLKPAAGTAVMVPLDMVEVGGLPKGSQAFKALSSRLEKRGINVVLAGGGSGGSASFSTPLEGGASLAAVICSGDFWMAGVGTVTYAHDNVVVGFGHPLEFAGPCGYGMANADVYGIWNTLDAPFKMVSLGATQGTVTQDRLYGIAGVLDPAPAEVAVDASATLGGDKVDTTTTMPQWVADSPDWGSYVAADACYAPVWRVTDSYNFPGYEVSHLVVNVADQADTTYPVTRDNVWDDTYDVGYSAGWEIYSVIDELQWNPNGTAPATLTGIDFSAALSPDHHSMRLLDFKIPGGLKIGDNTVHVVMRGYGDNIDKSRDLTLTLPPKTPKSGFIELYGNGEYAGWWGYSGDTSSAGTAAAPPATVADLVADINAWGHNDEAVLDFYPSSDSPLGADTVSSVTKITDGGPDWFVTGDVYKRTPSMGIRAMPSRIPPGMTVRLRGWLDVSDAAGTTIDLYRGKSIVPFATVPLKLDKSGYFEFSRKVANIRRTTVLTAVWGGSDNYIGATRTCKVKVMRP